MQTSNVMLSGLNEEFRIDAEYYTPANLRKEAIVLKHKYERLGKLCELIAGPFGSTVTSARYDPDSNKRYIRGKDVQEFFLDQSDAVYVESDLYDDLPQFHLKTNDLLITVVGMKFGKVSIVCENNTPAIFSCKSTLLRNPKVNVWYLLTYLSCGIGYGLVRRGERGAAQPGINLFDIRTVPVPLFSDKFQSLIEKTIKKSLSVSQKSADIFSSAQNSLLKEIGLENWSPSHQLSFIRPFSDTDKAGRFDAEFYQPKYENIVAAIKSCKGGWDYLGNLASIKKCVEVGSREYLDEGIPFVRVSNISPFDITEEKYISEKLYSEIKQHQPKKGEILFSKDGSPGIAHYIDEQPRKMIPSGGILRLNSKTKKINNEYLTLVLNSMLVKEQINRDVGGSIILHWRPDQVKETVIPILSEAKQVEIQKNVMEAISLRKKSKRLLECAKHSVEIAIEQGEKAAVDWLNHEVGQK
jgi:type I restriction enzyme S subunit